MQLGTVEIEFMDAVEDERIIKQVKTLLSSVEGSFVCNRKFGIRQDIIDQPMQVAQMKYVEDVYDKVEMFFPQLLVDDVSFTMKDETLYPKVYLMKNEDYEIDVSESDTEEDDVGEEDEYERF